MQHMVIYRAPDGRPSYQQAENLDDAVKFVEHLRNGEQIAEAAIFQMVAVPIAIKTYYKVELAQPVPPEPVTAATQPAPPSGFVAPDVVAATPPEEGAVPVSVGAAAASAAPEGGAVAQMVAPAPMGSGRFGLFNRG